ncbi:MAG: SUMF1/EgtB/PvdO family nonheme iron enzyme [Symploca sp. SIO1C2]|nr:SUMF1/EgtB/PvdO family nonheme iron enzyme [Symploca sp. SIO1C2]
MSFCINPNCPHPDNPDNSLFCKTCGSELLLAGRYRVSQLLSGKGGFGRTYEVSQGSTTKVLKVLINHEPKAIELFQQEARVLQQLNHPGIPRGDRYFTFTPRDSQQPLHCLVMEKIEGLDLEEYQKQRQNQVIAQDLALEWLIQLTQILDEVHQQQFFHRDIKPSNIILKPVGETIAPGLANYNSKQAYGDSPTGKFRDKTIPVGSFQIANAFGLYDMHGNVHEWCEDDWHDNYQGAPKDASAWVENSDNGNLRRLLRGGSWNCHPFQCRSASRLFNRSEVTLKYIGFRVVCS